MRFAEWHPGLKKGLRHRGAIVGLVLIALFVAMAIAAPWFAPHDPLAQNLPGGARAIIVAGSYSFLHKPLDFLRRVPRPLGDDLHLRRGKVGVRVHRHTVERHDSANRDETGQHQHQEPLPQSRLDDSMNHSDVANTIV
jgi:ABC-type dipeptide/oligopeptide/nickel transport system permease subunit